MSAQNSNLSASGYKYDLVTALSQNALNANLKNLIYSISLDAAPLTVYYKFNDSSHATGTSEMTQDEVDAMTGGQDPFAIPNGTSNTSGSSSDIALGNAMANANFAYAFSVTIGPPPGLSPAHMPDIITLSYTPDAYSGNDINQTVQYDMYFATFQMMQLTYGWNTWTAQQVAQPDNDPYIFEWLVDLNLTYDSSVPFDQLLVQVQNNLNAVYNLNTSTMFSLQQLLLDLNTPQLVNGADPSVIGFPPTDPIYTDLNYFIANYWSIMIAHGGITFSGSVSPNDTYPASSIIPTSLNFVVSPYSADPNNTGLYTLNYLVMTNNDTMPSPIQPFNWDWVTSSDPYAIMSVRRDLFVEYLNNALSPALAPICQVPTVDIEKDFLSKPTITYSIAQWTGTPKYTQNSANPVLTFNFDQSSSDWILSTQASVELKIAATVTLSGNQVICTTLLTLYSDITIDLVSKTRGYALAQQNTTTFTLSSVSSDAAHGGILNVTVTSDTQDLTQDTDSDAPYYDGDLDPSLFAKMITTGSINDFMDGLDDLTASIQSLMNTYDDAVKGVFNNCLAWVFPGAQTFFFDNPSFSNSLDLTVEVSYQAPS